MDTENEGSTRSARGALRRRAALWAGVCLAFCASPLHGADVTISEFLASNTHGLRDEDGDYPDWIELVNSGTNTVNMQGGS